MRAGQCKANPVLRQLTTLLGLLLTVLSTAYAEQLPLKSFRTTDGLLSDSVNSIVQDSRGFLWFGTSFGLSRFDGYGFTHYGEKEGLSYQNVNGLIETGDGAYWVCTNGGGVFRFHPDRKAGSRFTVYPVGDQPATNRVNSLYEDRGGRIWAGTDAGLFRLESEGAGKFLPVTLGVPSHPEQEMQVWSFVEDSEGSLWISTKFGLVRRLQDGRMLHYSMQPLSSGRDMVRALMLDREGRLWVGHESWLVIFKPLPPAVTPTQPPSVKKHKEQFPWRQLQNGGALEGKVVLPSIVGEARLYGVAPRVFCQSSDGNIWIGTEEHGLIEFDGAHFRGFTVAHGLSGNTIAANTLIEARGGDLWFGVAGSGAMRMSRSGFVTYTESDGLGDNRIGAIFEDQAGELYVTTARWQVNRLERRAEGMRFTSVRLNLPARITNEMWRPFRQIMRDHEGEWWVGTTEGLYRFPRVERIEQLGRVRPIAVYTARDGLVSDDVTHLFEDSRGDLWIGTFAPAREILTRWERATGKFHRYSDADSLQPSNGTLRFQEDAGGQVWVSFREGGLARYAAGRFRWFDTSDGLP
ncbi:MAG TPA: two-component regulator propeller domain-containing protein, partial [Pyrinomonadaceae bacterium]